MAWNYLLTFDSKEPFHACVVSSLIRHDFFRKLIFEYDANTSRNKFLGVCLFAIQ